MDKTVFYNQKGIEDRQIQELVGLTKGLLADGTLLDSEVKYLHHWLTNNLAIADHPLISRLYHNVAAILADGFIDDEEKENLFQTLKSFTGGEEIGEDTRSTELVFNDPAPLLDFCGRRFVMTGEFIFGQRSKCEQAVVDRGGETSRNVSGKVNFVVIGTYASGAWKHGNFGRKIEKACELRSKGKPVAIVSEDHWRAAL